MTLTDCTTVIDTSPNEEGIDADEITVTGGKLKITAMEEALESAGKITLTDVDLELITTLDKNTPDAMYYPIYLHDREGFTLPGNIRLYDMDGNVIYEGKWDDKLLIALPVDGPIDGPPVPWREGAGEDAVYVLGVTNADNTVTYAMRLSATVPKSTPATADLTAAVLLVLPVLALTACEIAGVGVGFSTLPALAQGNGFWQALKNKELSALSDSVNFASLWARMLKTPAAPDMSGFENLTLDGKIYYCDREKCGSLIDAYLADGDSDAFWSGVVSLGAPFIIPKENAARLYEIAAHPSDATGFAGPEGSSAIELGAESADGEYETLYYKPPVGKSMRVQQVNRVNGVMHDYPAYILHVYGLPLGAARPVLAEDILEKDTALAVIPERTYNGRVSAAESEAARLATSREFYGEDFAAARTLFAETRLSLVLRSLSDGVGGLELSGWRFSGAERIEGGWRIKYELFFTLAGEPVSGCWYSLDCTPDGAMPASGAAGRQSADVCAYFALLENMRVVCESDGMAG